MVCCAEFPLLDALMSNVYVLLSASAIAEKNALRFVLVLLASSFVDTS